MTLKWIRATSDENNIPNKLHTDTTSTYNSSSKKTPEPFDFIRGCLGSCERGPLAVRCITQSLIRSNFNQEACPHFYIRTNTRKALNTTET